MRPRLRRGKGLSPQRAPRRRLHFHYADGFATPGLAHMLHSLVRVSRRVGCGHSDANDRSARCDRPPARHPRHRRGDTASSDPRGRSAGRRRPSRPPAGGGQPALRARRTRAELSSVASRSAETPGCKLSARTRSHLPHTTSWAGSNCRWPAARRSAEPLDGHPDHRRGSNRVEPGPARRLLSLTGGHFSRIRFPPNGFAVFLTLFSKYFSPFPHGTCSLSVSCQYLALDGVYHPLWAAIPNNPTLRRQ